MEGIKPCCYQKKIKNRAQKPAAMDSCFGLVRRHQHGTASKLARGINVMVAFVRMSVASTSPTNTLTLSSQATSHSLTNFHHINTKITCGTLKLISKKLENRK